MYTLVVLHAYTDVVVDLFIISSMYICISIAFIFLFLMLNDIMLFT